MINTLVRKNTNNLFGICSEIAEVFREKGFCVHVYPDKLDNMDLIDKTNVNLIIYGENNSEDFYGIINGLIESGNKILSSGTRYHLNQTQSLDNYYLFGFCGKRIKIRDRINK